MVRIYIKTFGCSANQSDSEIMEGILVDSGTEIVHCIENADMVVVNTCTVKSATEVGVIRYLKRLPKIPVVVTGCLAQARPELFTDYTVLGTYHIHRIKDAVLSALANKPEKYLNMEHDEQMMKRKKLELPYVRKNKVIEILPISVGCLGECSYCHTKFAKGRLVSFREYDVVNRAKKAIAEGAKEIWLTSQDTAAYGIDTGTNLVSLLEKLVKIDGDFHIRLGMANPEHIMPLKKRLSYILKNDKMFKFLHIPVQSGNDRILGLMERKYTTKDFIETISYFRREIPKITISTDIICGFPGETDKEFLDTLKLVEEVKPGVLNISRYSQRPGTKSAALKPQAGSVIKSRSRAATKLFSKISLQENRKWIGWHGWVLVDEYHKSFVGRNYAYKQVVLSEAHTLGTKVNVKVKSVTSYDLRA
ncbi:MAG: tRNA (N(6)-L-threonylcarbamoyladenosine(37)-C(2))-methylthiotransferase [Candidatus Woesearchaeota archaeon]